MDLNFWFGLCDPFDFRIPDIWWFYSKRFFFGYIPLVSMVKFSPSIPFLIDHVYFLLSWKQRYRQTFIPQFTFAILLFTAFIIISKTLFSLLKCPPRILMYVISLVIYFVCILKCLWIFLLLFFYSLLIFLKKNSFQCRFFCHFWLSIPINIHSINVISLCFVINWWFKFIGCNFATVHRHYFQCCSPLFHTQLIKWLI